MLLINNPNTFSYDFFRFTFVINILLKRHKLNMYANKYRSKNTDNLDKSEKYE